MSKIDRKFLSTGRLIFLVRDTSKIFNYADLSYNYLIQKLELKLLSYIKLTRKNLIMIFCSDQTQNIYIMLEYFFIKI